MNYFWFITYFSGFNRVYFNWILMVNISLMLLSGIRIRVFDANIAEFSHADLRANFNNSMMLTHMKSIRFWSFRFTFSGSSGTIACGWNLRFWKCFGYMQRTLIDGVNSRSDQEEKCAHNLLVGFRIPCLWGGLTNKCSFKLFSLQVLLFRNNCM